MYSMRINWFLSMAQILSALLPHANNISGYYYLLFVNSQSALFSFKVPVDDCFSQSIGDLLFPHKMPKYLFTKIIRHFDHCHDKVSNLLIMNFKSSNFCYWNILFASDFIYQLSARLMEFRACIIHFSSKHQPFVRQIPSSFSQYLIATLWCWRRQWKRRVFIEFCLVFAKASSCILKQYGISHAVVYVSKDKLERR